jgi:hypothetical protein
MEVPDPGGEEVEFFARGLACAGVAVKHDDAVFGGHELFGGHCQVGDVLQRGSEDVLHDRFAAAVDAAP